MTPTTPIPAVQQAIYDMLTGDTTLMGLIAGVHDHVPETAEHPYVVIGEVTEVPDNAHDRFGRETVPTVHVWSKYRGFSEALEIATRIVELLDHQSLTISGQHHIATRHEFIQTLDDPDPEIRHVPLRFRVVTEQQGE